MRFLELGLRGRVQGDANRVGRGCNAGREVAVEFGVVGRQAALDLVVVSRGRGNAEKLKSRQKHKSYSRYNLEGSRDPLLRSTIR